MATTIRYKGVDIGTVEPGKAVKIKCAGKKMKTDVSVAVEALKLQEKSTDKNGEVTPDAGYDGLSKVTVNVAGEVIATYDGSVRDEMPVLLMVSDGAAITDSDGTQITLKE